MIQLLNHDEKDIDEAYLEDFNTLKRQIKDYLEKVAIKMIIFSILLNYIAFKTYLGGRRKDRNNVEISGDYDLVKTLTDNVLESVYWLKDKGVHFDRSFVDMPVGALWRRGHKPMKAQGLEYIENLGDYVKQRSWSYFYRNYCRKIN